MENLIGHTLSNRYKIVQFLGQGGMALVFKAWDQERATHLALKLLRQDLSQDIIFIRRFEREAHNLEKLQHPNIVRFYGIGRDRQYVFLLMDFIEGKTLQEEIFLSESQPFGTSRILHVSKSICTALHYAHNQRLVHCDIKPGNIMIDQNDSVLLTDFGIARMTDSATSTMIGMGTPAYMAPELIKGKDPVPASDIYSVGIILYQMVTGGERPFTGERAGVTGTTSEKVRWEQINLQPPSPANYSRTLSSKLENVILKCLSKTPNDRYTTAIDLLNAIGLACQEPDSTMIEPFYERQVVEKESDPSEAKIQRIEDVKPEVQIRSKFLTKWISSIVILITAVIFIFSLINRNAQNGDSSSQAIVETPTKVIASPPTTQTFTEPSPQSPKPTSTTPPIPTSTHEIKLALGSMRTNDKDQAVMVYVPEGEFIMGSDTDVLNYPREKPAHPVYLDAYWIYQTEVTNAQFVKFLNEYGNVDENGTSMIMTYDHNAEIRELWHKQNDQQIEGNVNISENPFKIYYENEIWQVIDGAENLPVVWVNWYGSNFFCQWAGGRLPTEAEWEKAARGTDGRDYPWGNTPPNKTLANYGGYYGELTNVGTFVEGASPYGAYDMAGNVKEWVSDVFSQGYYSDFENNYFNPTGPEKANDASWTGGFIGLARGGGFVSSPEKIKTWIRNSSVSSNRYRSNTGFRCVVDIIP